MHIPREPSLFFHEQIGALLREKLGLIKHLRRRSFNYSFNYLSSGGDIFVRQIQNGNGILKEIH